VCHGGVVMRIRIKICGITNPADAEEAAGLGADAIGLNFYAKSPRCIDEATARRIVKALPPFVDPVALFVNEPLLQAQQIAQRLGIRTVQVHGDVQGPWPPGEMCWIPAFSVGDAAGLAALEMALARMATAPAAILVDAHVAGMFGGTGQVVPWHLLAAYRPSVPLILAGGLTPDNVAEAIRIVRPAAVDVASGVESRPGKKDVEKMRRFIDAVRGVGE
jgi:phosphoribosylanthranilate isomerase